jgi:hypothetical protein
VASLCAARNSPTRIRDAESPRCHRPGFALHSTARRHPACRVHGLRSWIYRRDAESSATHRQSVRTRVSPMSQVRSVTYVSGSDNGHTGGWGGIRTPGEREPTPVFKTGALNHSATHPSLRLSALANLHCGTNWKLATDWPRNARITRWTVRSSFSSPPRSRWPRRYRL